MYASGEQEGVDYQEELRLQLRCFGREVLYNGNSLKIDPDVKGLFLDVLVGYIGQEGPQLVTTTAQYFLPVAFEDEVGTIIRARFGSTISNYACSKYGRGKGLQVVNSFQCSRELREALQGNSRSLVLKLRNQRS